MNQVHGKDFGKNPQRRSAFLGPPALPASPGQSIDICRSEETLSDVVGGSDLAANGIDSSSCRDKPTDQKDGSGDARKLRTYGSWAEYFQPKSDSTSNAGTQPPVTCNTGGTTRISGLETGGVDTLEVSIYGHHQPKTFGWLTGQLRAKTPLAQDGQPAFIDCPEGDLLMVEPHGANMCKWVVRWQGCRIGIANRVGFSESVLSFRVSLGSLYLMQHGHIEGWRRLTSLLSSIGFTIERSIVSRIDLCVDLVDVSMRVIRSAIEGGREVCHAKKDRIYRNRGKDVWETYSIGKGQVMLRCYDKVAELRDQPEKFVWLVDNRWGKVPEHAVRIEFQLKGKNFRKTFGVKSVEEVFASIGTMADWCTKKWFRINAKAVDRQNRNQGKSELDPFWKRVQKAFSKWACPARPRTSRPLKKVPDRRQLFDQGVGVISSEVALKLNSGADAKEVIRSTLKAMEYEIRKVVPLRRMKFEALGYVMDGDVPFD